MLSKVVLWQSESDSLVLKLSQVLLNSIEGGVCVRKVFAGYAKVIGVEKEFNCQDVMMTL